MPAWSQVLTALAWTAGSKMWDYAHAKTAQRAQELSQRVLAALTLALLMSCLLSYSVLSTVVQGMIASFSGTLSDGEQEYWAAFKQLAVCGLAMVALPAAVRHGFTLPSAECAIVTIYATVVSLTRTLLPCLRMLAYMHSFNQFLLQVLLECEATLAGPEGVTTELGGLPDSNINISCLSQNARLTRVAVSHILAALLVLCSTRVARAVTRKYAGSSIRAASSRALIECALLIFLFRRQLQAGAVNDLTLKLHSPSSVGLARGFVNVLLNFAVLDILEINVWDLVSVAAVVISSSQAAWATVDDMQKMLAQVITRVLSWESALPREQARIHAVVRLVGPSIVCLFAFSNDTWCRIPLGQSLGVCLSTAGAIAMLISEVMHVQRCRIFLPDMRRSEAVAYMLDIDLVRQDPRIAKLLDVPPVELALDALGWVWGQLQGNLAHLPAAAAADAGHVVDNVIAAAAAGAPPAEQPLLNYTQLNEDDAVIIVAGRVNSGKSSLCKYLMSIPREDQTLVSVSSTEGETRLPQLCVWDDATQACHAVENNPIQRVVLIDMPGSDQPELNNPAELARVRQAIEDVQRQCAYALVVFVVNGNAIDDRIQGAFRPFAGSPCSIYVLLNGSGIPDLSPEARPIRRNHLLNLLLAGSTRPAELRPREFLVDLRGFDPLSDPNLQVPPGRLELDEFRQHLINQVSERGQEILEHARQLQNSRAAEAAAQGRWYTGGFVGGVKAAVNKALGWGAKEAARDAGKRAFAKEFVEGISKSGAENAAGIAKHWMAKGVVPKTFLNTESFKNVHRVAKEAFSETMKTTEQQVLSKAARASTRAAAMAGCAVEALFVGYDLRQLHKNGGLANHKGAAAKRVGAGVVSVGVGVLAAGVFPPFGPMVASGIATWVFNKAVPTGEVSA